MSARHLALVVYTLLTVVGYGTYRTFSVAAAPSPCTITRRPVQPGRRH